MRRLAICGAGPSGLTIAGILARTAPSAFDISVFERDSRERDQGAGWDVDDDGRKALSAAGLDVSAISRPGSDTFRIFLANASEPLMVMGMPRNSLFSRPGDLEVNRHAMREGLLDAIGDSAPVRFECRADAVRTSASSSSSSSSSSPLSGSDGEPSPVELLAKDGEVLGEFDLVLDTCGVSSPLRRFRVQEDSDASDYTGLTMLYGELTNPDTHCDALLLQRLGEGTVSVMGDLHDHSGATNMFLQRFGADLSDRRTTLGIMLARPNPEDLFNELGLPLSSRPVTSEQAKHIQQWLCDRMGDAWPAMYHDCVQHAHNFTLRPLRQHPIHPTLINDDLPFLAVGDSLHALPPYSGSSGNHALAAAADVAGVLAKAAKEGADKASTLSQLRAMEKKLLKRVERKHKWTLNQGKSLQHHLQTPNFEAGCTLETLIRGGGPSNIWTRLGAWLIQRLMKAHKKENYGMKELK